MMPQPIGWTMHPVTAIAALDPRRWTRRAVPWIGGVFIAVIAALAAYDIVRSWRETVRDTGSELEAHARVIAEQTARSLQAVDVVLRHFVERSQRGQLEPLGEEQWHRDLYQQSVGLVQTAGLYATHASGVVRAASGIYPLPDPAPDASALALFQVHRGVCCDVGLYIGDALKSVTDGVWAFPMTRRLESLSGAFAGIIGARGRVDYFQQFYGDVRLGAGTQITLMHQNGTLLARHPAVESALGQQFALFEQMLAARAAAPEQPIRAVSPIDGVDRFGALQVVSDYPLAVIVTRDVAVALAPWRSQARGTAIRTLALGALAVALLAIAQRQLARLHAARRSLEASQERFEVAVAGSDDGIWDWDLRTGSAFGSARARAIVGLAAGPEMQSTDEWFAAVEAKLHPDDVLLRRAAIEAHMAGRTPTYEGELRVRGDGGGYRWIRVRGVCIRDAAGKPYRMAGSVSDIDARKRAEASLRQSDERYQLAVDGANQGMWDWDLDRDLLFLSPRAQLLTFETSGEGLRPRREWLAQTEYHPDDTRPLLRAFAQHLRGATPHFNAEFRMRHHSGEWRWFSQRGVTLRDANGRAWRMAGSLEDISERKRSEVERERLEVQLRQAQKLESIGTLAGGIAHDFNNILSAILGYGELAQKSAPEGSPLRRHVDASIAAGQRAKSLVERILAFSRSGVGERVPVHVQSVVDEALDAVATSLPAGVKLVPHLNAGDAGVLGDPTQIHQVVLNLCANAVQAMKGEGRLVVRLAVPCLPTPLVVATSTLPAGEYLRLDVEDSGAGIEPRLLERIFDPFFTTKEVGVGTGLGLSLVHGIVTDLGGGIAVQSEVGRGSCFTVYLPSRSQVAAPQAELPVESERGTGQTVMLVDDEEALVRLGEEALAEIGYEPVGFTSPEAALEALRAEPSRFDVLLADEAMPGLAGSELAHRALALRPGLPVVLMSGYVAPALVQRAREAGVAEVLSKPLAQGEIARALAGALRGARRPAS